MENELLEEAAGPRVDGLRRMGGKAEKKRPKLLLLPL